MYTIDFDSFAENFDHRNICIRDRIDDTNIKVLPKRYQQNFTEDLDWNNCESCLKNQFDLSKWYKVWGNSRIELILEKFEKDTGRY